MKGPLSVFFYGLHPLALAIIIDIIKIIPYFDIFITVWLQVILWNHMIKHTPFMWLNISYDLTFDMLYPPFGDIVPTNTICVIVALVYNHYDNVNI